MWALWSLLANVNIAFIEAVNHSARSAHWGRTLLITALPIVCAQWALFRAWQAAPSLLAAWAVFTVGNTVLRLLSTYFWAHHAVTVTQLVALGVMLAAAYFVKG